MCTLVPRQAPRVLAPSCRAVARGLATTTASAKDAADKVLETFYDRTLSSKQVLDGHQLRKLSLTLNRKRLHPDVDVAAAPPPAGTPLPRGYHLVFFAPAAVEAELGADGTDKTFNAPAPFTRRMWAGGKMEWSKGVPLRVGEEVEERTRLLSAVPKRSGRDGGEMVLVQVEKEFWGPGGLALVDQRSWIFRPEMQDASESSGQPPSPTWTPKASGPTEIRDLAAKEGKSAERHFKWSPVGLFRFSGLTFNGHMIHYSDPWTRDIEGFPGPVVHGPLHLINMMDYWRDLHGKDGKEAKEVSYRALSPTFAGQPYFIRSADVRDAGSGKSWELLVERDGGKAIMRGEVLSEN